MNKKKFYILTTCSMIAVLIIFQIVMYYVVGEDILMQKGPLRTFWILFTPFIISLSFVRNLIMKRKFKDNDLDNSHKNNMN